MNKEIIKQIALELNIKEIQVSKTLSMLEEGDTIPFIARYRKEVTGNLDEDKIKSISDVYEYQVNLLKRKEDVIRLIDEKGLLTDKLKEYIKNAKKLVDVEDIYRPYKEKKKTKATDAINNGLEPLAKIILSFPDTLYVDKFINDKVKTKEEAIEGAKYIIAEYISDNAYYRKWIRNFTYNTGKIKSKIKKNAIDEKKVYEMYYDYIEEVKYIKPHRVLALNRGEKENVLSISIEVEKNKIYEYLENKLVKKDNECKNYVECAIKDSYARLIEPSIEREIRSELTDIASEKSIKVFSSNLENYLLTPPMKGKMILGLDPAFRTGCKLAVIDETGKMLDIKVIYPTEPHNDYEGSKKIVLDLINKYKIEVVAIGNGTASRESTDFISKVIKEENLSTKYIIVNEAGASVYSASKLAKEEFPDLTLEKRSAISIARRLQDPLSELVKIDPKSIGVGEYQHDVKEKELNDSLTFVVSKVVNSVGVNINTASSSILNYISGLTKRSIDKLIEYRNKNGAFKNRKEIEKLLTPKTYEQAIGFIRVPNSDNVLDKTSIHPESYEVASNLLEKISCSYLDIGTDKLIDELDNIDIEKEAKELNTDFYTLEDIIKSLKKPNRDPRDEVDRPILRSDVLHIEDLEKGMKLEGTVRNVVDFGAFIDIGIKNDGLVHISEITDSYIKHPSDVLSVGDIVTVYVKEIFKDKGKVSLTMKGE